MKMKRIHYLFTSLIIILILLPLGTLIYVYAVGPTYYALNDNQTVIVDQTYVCTRVKNNACAGTAVFIPTKTSTEWTNFNSNHPACIAINPDMDGDGYSIDKATYCSQGATPTGTANDCQDDYSSVNPGQTSYFTIDRGDGSFDYDCNGTEDSYYTAIVCGGAKIGWVNSIPACGAVGNYCPTAIYPYCSAGCSMVTNSCR